MQRRLIQVGNKGFDLNSVIGWETDCDEGITIYLSGMEKSMSFSGKEAWLLATLLNLSATYIGDVELAIDEKE